MNKLSPNITQYISKEKTDFSLQEKNLLKLGWSNDFVILDEEELLSVSHLKRFFERWHGDSDFRNQLLANSHEAVLRYNIKVDPEEIRPLWDKESAEKFSEEKHPEEIPASELLEHYRSFTQKTRPELMKSVGSSSSNPRFKGWRQRQIARTTSQFKQLLHDALAHAPVCFELSKGCSVGCWFCGVSAPRLSDIFFYTQENAKLWREVLELMKEILGSAAGAGFCYWASDPLDNPDYEKFCSDFHEILGGFPQTTTAQPMKDPERVRAFLKLSKEKGCPLNRFSILSLKVLNQVHEEFSAEELALVKLVLLHEEGNIPKATAGRARERQLKKGEKDNKTYSPDQGTIACATGFLFNMVDRSVKLISPCNADERWPLGYIIYDEGTFSNVNDLKLLLERMIDNHMSLTVRQNDSIGFRRDLRYESLPDGFQLSTNLKTFKFQNDPYLRELGELINKGDKTAAEIAFLFDIRGISPEHTFHNLNLLLSKGVLDNEPKSKTAAVTN
ncbi:radical SAM family RiPP maturation amino acid epimerase [Scytonema sp. NUACC26]|uniref:radical SAM family RiPP maturation amino acid epimerase n=1 Tax=Scytonema sp. NUACC26 TaxID=3140176 RepID=UPI0034DBC8CF